MKKLQNSNDKYLEHYLRDFTPELKKYWINELSAFYTLSVLEFNKIVYLKINITKIGKHTHKYWLERGWNKKEIELKRTHIKQPKSPMTLKYWLEKGYSEEDAAIKIKEQRKNSIYYWLKRGYSEEEAKHQVVNYQKNSSKVLTNKLLYDLEFREEHLKKINTNVEYYINLGYDIETAKTMLSERQNTFTLDKCIQKHGEEVGNKIWKERQLNWQKELKKVYFYDKNDSNSVKFLIEKYDDWYWIAGLCRLTILIDIKKLLLKAIVICNGDINIFSNYIVNNLQNVFVGYTTYDVISRIRIIQEYFKLNKKQLLYEIASKKGLVKTGFATKVPYNGYIFKSVVEYNIAIFLENNNIEYEYEKKYKNTRYTSDFYLPSTNYYIEYDGMTKVGKKYENKYIKKNE
jgi:hypothetical protein